MGEAWASMRNKIDLSGRFEQLRPHRQYCVGCGQGEQIENGGLLDVQGRHDQPDQIPR
jgi:hypothetical protein